MSGGGVELAPAGARGPVGPAGTDGYPHIQSTPAATWLVIHNLGRRTIPAVTLDDFPGELVYTDVCFIDDNTTTLTWPFPVAGRADF